jgi:hypothetical protein
MPAFENWRIMLSKTANVDATITNASATKGPDVVTWQWFAASKWYRVHPLNLWCTVLIFGWLQENRDKNETGHELIEIFVLCTRYVYWYTYTPKPSHPGL